MQTTEAVQNNDYDSEEERLLLYRKVRKELDEDEARRNEEESQREDSESEERNEDTQIAEDKIIFQLPSLFPKSNFSSAKRGDEPPAGESQRTENPPSSFGVGPRNVFGGHAHAHAHALEQNAGEQHLFSPPEATPQVHDGPAAPEDPESFSCGELEGEDPRPISWTSFGFRRKEEEDSDEGVGFRGLPSALASEALGRGLALRAKEEEEVFGGLGEGSDGSSEEKNDDSSEE